ncbi:MAG: putative ABC transporter permease [Candidatus Saccharibacteria bacterium]|nr:putative ABC transporter permease [Candidatus Saccharibacteria bacterium]
MVATKGRRVVRGGYKETYRKYLRGRVGLTFYRKMGVMLLVFVVSGFLGWLWEFSLNEVTDGFRVFYVKGGNLLPWINLYAYGAVLVVILTYKIRRYPVLVFLVSAIATGILELVSGLLVYIFGNGTRYWNYLDDWWGVGNINGFVCPASVVAFGIGSLVLMYGLLPFCMYLARKANERKFVMLIMILFMLVMADEVTNLALKNLGLPTAMDFYHSLGFKYK